MFDVVLLEPDQAFCKSNPILDDKNLPKVVELTQGDSDHVFTIDASIVSNGGCSYSMQLDTDYPEVFSLSHPVFTIDEDG